MAEPDDRKLRAALAAALSVADATGRAAIAARLTACMDVLSQRRRDR